MTSCIGVPCSLCMVPIRVQYTSCAVALFVCGGPAVLNRFVLIHRVCRSGFSGFSRAHLSLTAVCEHFRGQCSICQTYQVLQAELCLKGVGVLAFSSVHVMVASVSAQLFVPVTVWVTLWRVCTCLGSPINGPVYRRCFTLFQVLNKAVHYSHNPCVHTLCVSIWITRKEGKIAFAAAVLPPSHQRPQKIRCIVR